MRRNIETYLRPLNDCRRELIFHHFFENVFLARPADLKIQRQTSSKFHDAVVKERGANFDRMGHAHAVRLHQDVVRKIVVLVELQERSDSIARKACFEMSENIGKSAW
jgi:hypothetical protein